MRVSAAAAEFAELGFLLRMWVRRAAKPHAVCFRSLAALTIEKPPISSTSTLTFPVALSLSARPAPYSARPAAADDVKIPFPPRHVHVREAGLDEEGHRREATELPHVVWDHKVAAGAQCCVEHPE